MCASTSDRIIRDIDQLIGRLSHPEGKNDETIAHLLEARDAYQKQNAKSPTASTVRERRPGTSGVLYGEIGHVLKCSNGSPAWIEMDEFFSSHARRPAWIVETSLQFSIVNNAIKRGKSIIDGNGLARKVRDPDNPSDFRLLAYCVECISKGKVQLRPYIEEIRLPL